MVPVETQIPNPEQLDLLHIKLKVGKNFVIGDLSEDLHIPEDPEMLIQEMSKIPSLLCYWSAMAEVAKREQERLKNQFELWWAEKYMESKRTLILEFGKSGVTEVMVKALLFENYRDEYDKWQDELAKADYRRSILNVAANAFKEKGQAMINIMSWKKAQLNAE